jgi:UDP-3-O-acyl-N-acetylglucosamine deacetylase
VELIEHAMAALAGLQIDNCLVELDGPEVPGCDGSSLPFVKILIDAGIQSLDVRRAVYRFDRLMTLEIHEPNVSVFAAPMPVPGLRITYDLNYGPDSPIPQQLVSLNVNPATFARDIAFARTFILESEVQAFLAQGIGRRLSFQDLLIYGPDGVVGNQLRSPDECVRHKILDCVGDLALLGCDLAGHVTFRRTGHRHNAEFVRAIEHQGLISTRQYVDAA